MLLEVDRCNVEEVMREQKSKINQKHTWYIRRRGERWYKYSKTKENQEIVIPIHMHPTKPYKTSRRGTTSLVQPLKDEDRSSAAESFLHINRRGKGIKRTNTYHVEWQEEGKLATRFTGGWRYDRNVGIHHPTKSLSRKTSPKVETSQLTNPLFFSRSLNVKRGKTRRSRKYPKRRNRNSGKKKRWNRRGGRKIPGKSWRPPVKRGHVHVPIPTWGVCNWPSLTKGSNGCKWTTQRKNSFAFWALSFNPSRQHYDKVIVEREAGELMEFTSL